jgi:hypothetical protein
MWKVDFIEINPFDSQRCYLQSDTERDDLKDHWLWRTLYSSFPFVHGSSEHIPMFLNSWTLEHLQEALWMNQMTRPSLFSYGIEQVVRHWEICLIWFYDYMKK